MTGRNLVSENVREAEMWVRNGMHCVPLPFHQSVSLQIRALFCPSRSSLVSVIYNPEPSLIDKGYFFASTDKSIIRP